MQDCKDRPTRDYTVCFLFTPGLDSVLLQVKGKTDFKGLLNGVGGKLEPNETPRECALREIHEETGIDAPGKLAWIGTLSLPGNCDNHARSSDPAEPACVLYYYAGTFDPETFSPPEDAERLVLRPVAEILDKPVTHGGFAGNGDLQYFVGRGIDALRAAGCKDRNDLGLDPTEYGLDAAGASQVEVLSPDQLEYAYRIRKQLYLIEDARGHAEGLLSEDPDKMELLGEDDWPKLVKKFESQRNAGRDEDSTWDDVIWEYVCTKQGLQEGAGT